MLYFSSIIFLICCTLKGLSIAKVSPTVALSRSMAGGERLAVGNPGLKPRTKSIRSLRTPHHAVMGTCFAMDHIKAAGSRAIAVTTVLRFLPVADRRLNRAQSLTWHFHEMSLTSFTDPRPFEQLRGYPRLITIRPVAQIPFLQPFWYRTYISVYSEQWFFAKTVNSFLDS